MTALDSEHSMLSDDEDDMPLASQSHNGKMKNGHVSMNGAGSGKGRVLDADGDTPMSDPDDDDVPLSQVTRSDALTPSKRKRRAAPVSDFSDDDDDKPLALTSSPPKHRHPTVTPKTGSRKATTLPASTSGTNGKVKPEESDSDDTPLNSHLASSSKARAKPKSASKRKVKVENPENDLESEDDKPAPAKKVAQPKKKRKVAESDADKQSVKKAAPRKVKKDSGSETEATKANVKKKGKVKKEETAETGSKGKKVEEGAEGKDAKKSKGKQKEEKEKDEETEEIFKWWEQDPDQTVVSDGTQKWTTLEHNGVIFPPPYQPLPSHVKMKYNGKSVNLPLESEEVAGFYGAMLETDHAKDATFNKNFFDDWSKVLKKHPPRDGTMIKDFERCDFRPMFEYFEEEKAKKKALTSAEKKELKKQKDEMEAKYVTCTLDGRKEKVGNFRVEPPGLFRGRGEHPKKGALKLRVCPEDITINIGPDAPIPIPNIPGKWKEVIHDNTVTWLATWTENINGNHKYVFLAAGSSLKGQSDMSKFEKARELKMHVERIRADYRADLKNKVTQLRMRATAMYFIDVLALRAGNEKGEDEADTVGCCSLRCEHVTLEPPNFVIFDFLGKDSIRYYNKVTVDEQVFKNIKIFKRDKQDSDGLFDRVNPGYLNKHLQSYMKGLSAKVFRTYNASITFQNQLDEGTPETGTMQEKLNHYNHANRMVAILCNHQRAAPKTHDQSMAKMKEKLRGFKYDRMKLRHALFASDAKYKKQKKYAEDESDLDEDAVAEHEEQCKAREIERTEKKFAKENEKLAEEGKPTQDEDVLRSRLRAVEDDFARLEKERGTGKAALKRDRPVEKLTEAIDKLEEKIKAFKLQMVDREAGKEVALGTSKINYLDPRITAAWCKKHDVPIEKIFSKTLITKFPWAMEVEPEWKF
ncbi:DNA topoisomerase I [Lactarius indigo]|nr:DNA topoisomerase I [Lactarius indigo]